MKGDISALLPKGTLLFSAYADDYLQLNGHKYHSGLYIHQNNVTAPWGPERLHALSIEDLQPLIVAPPEVLILGTGRVTAFPDPDILDYMAEHHIGFECMDSRAAARTYNILVGEGRTVSAAMLLPGVRK
ncbi:Mth938-like domain-containing protein [Mariprofundus ferrooxydans]|nr:Mth938-like domain-containing protein [Mariprofundus ferrooxydans]